MKKGKFLVFIFISFACGLFYLHQKTKIYVEAYKLSKNYDVYNELVDRKDYLMYNFDKEICVPRVNQWVEENSFSFTGESKEVVLNLKEQKPSVRENKLASLFNRFLEIPAEISSALAGNKE